MAAGIYIVVAVLGLVFVAMSLLGLTAENS
jgi:hypothetical protein